MATSTLSSTPGLPVPTSVDYTSRDFLGMKYSLQLFATQAMPQWNVYASEGDFGVMMLELFAYVGDILSLYTDRVGQEAYVTTATQRLSLLNIANLLGYIVSNGTASQGSVTFTTSNPGQAVIIPPGTGLVSTFNSTADQPVLFYTDDVVTVPENGASATVNVSQGQIYTMVPIGLGTGQAGQQITLPNLNILDGSVDIFVQTVGGESAVAQWAQVYNFVDNGPSDTVYTVTVNPDETDTVTFGDGVNGLVPALNLQIYASYTTIVGSQGNMGADLISLINSSTITGVTVTGSSEMSGGADAESNDSIRANAPAVFATQERAVSLADFDTLALNVPGVTACSAVANHSTSVNLYFLGPGGLAPSTQLTDNVVAYFTGPPSKILAGVSLNTPAPNLVPVDIGSTGSMVTLSVQSTYSQQDVVNAVQAALTNLLTVPQTSFGMTLNISAIYHTIMSVPGVQYTIVPVFQRDDINQTGSNTTPIVFQPSEIPVPGTFWIYPMGGV